MDCLCCADGGVGPATDSEFLGSVCNLKRADGVDAKFPAEPGRYVLYVIAGCPFAARPWSVIGFYGLEESIPLVKLFPASHSDGWFFEPQSDGEHELVKAFPDAKVDKVDPYHLDLKVHHLKQLYEMANKEFKGAISVPLLWDIQQDTAVSNSSLGLAEMIATQMRTMATRNQNVLLFPSRTEAPEEYEEHNQLVKMLHSKVTTAVYRMNATKSGREHDDMIDAYYKTLDELQARIADQFLMGSQIRFADIVLFISLVRLDLAYCWRFGLGRRTIHNNYPGLQNYVNRIMGLPGIADTVLPRDIMALYFMSLKWVENGKGRTLPQVPESWENASSTSSKSK